MARPPRNHIPGAFYHITQRGNAQQRIFFSDEDRCKFCLLMQEGTERFGHRIHAFCLMDNHIHLLVQAGDQPLGKAMQNLTFRYAKRLNKKFNTTGHRFQGRYFSGMIDTDRYLHEVVKYIHLNPVKANIVQEPSNYLWSSHNHYIKKDFIPWVYRDYNLQGFGTDEEQAIAQYLSFVTTPQCDDMLSLIGGSTFEYYIGDDKFVEHMHKKAHDKAVLTEVDFNLLWEHCCYSILGKSDQIEKSSRSRQVAFIRGVAGYIVANHTTVSLSKLARAYNKSQATMSRSVEKISARLPDDPILQSKIAEVLNQLSCAEG